MTLLETEDNRSTGPDKKDEKRSNNTLHTTLDYAETPGDKADEVPLLCMRTTNLNKKAERSNINVVSTDDEIVGAERNTSEKNKQTKKTTTVKHGEKLSSLFFATAIYCVNVFSRLILMNGFGFTESFHISFSRRTV